MFLHNPVAIVGGSHTFEYAPFSDLSIDIWAFNNKGTHYPRLSALIDIHSTKEQERYAGHIDWLKKTNIPVYTRTQREDMSSCIPYPFDEVLALTNHVRHKGKRLEYFTSSPSMAIALAIVQNRPKIYLYGMELTSAKEYREQRDCFTFWVGFAAGRGIQIDINCATGVFDKPIYYGRG